MSANDTNLEKAQAQHKPALIGIKASMLWAGVLLLALLGWLAFNGNTPEETGATNDVGPGIDVGEG